MTPQQALLKVVGIVGSQSKLARELGRELTQSHIYHWLHKAQVVPAEYCPDIEHLVGRAVMCEDLNPRVNWAVLRNSPPYQPSSSEVRSDGKPRPSQQRR